MWLPLAALLAEAVGGPPDDDDMDEECRDSALDGLTGDEDEGEGEESG